MRLAHLSDLHLGFRAFPRADRGWNLRERDLAQAFQQAVQEILALRPDLILVTGDLFDHPDPPNTAFLTLLRGLDAFRTRLPGVPVLAIAGERDTPRNPADPGPLAALDLLPGVEAAAGAPRAVRIRDTRVHALLLPHRSLLRAPHPEIRPDPRARWNLLLLRGDPAPDGPSVEVDPSEWSYVALGGGHVAHSPAAGVWCAGSLERVGPNPWSEATEEKGFVVFDLEAGTAELHALPARPVVDLAPVRTSSGELEAGTRRVRDVLEGVPGGIEGKILRIRLRGDLLAPDEGAAAGLLAAVRTRAAHVEFRLLDDPPASHPGPRQADPWLLGLELGDGTGEASFLALEPGPTVLTAADPETRRRLGAVLREAPRRAGSGGGAEGSPPGAEPPFLPPVKLRFGGESRGSADPDPLGLLAWGGAGEPETLFRAGASLLLEGPASAAVPGGGDRKMPPARGSRELAAMQDELRRLRVDAMEAAGDMEAGNLEWARGRQDAESRLRAYRERARELRHRIRDLEADGEAAPCPTCGRPVGESLPGLVRALREEWEAVVQDGRWWKRRREQMEEKPEDLRALEARALELHSGVEILAEKVERVRDRPGREESEGAGGDARPKVRGSGAGREDALESGREARRLLQRAGTILHRLTEGAVGGARWEEGELRVVDAAGRSRAPTGEEGGSLGFSVHLALWGLAREQGRAPGGIVLTELAGDQAGPVARRALELGPWIFPRDVPVLVVAAPEGARGAPEEVRSFIEVVRTAGGRPSFRREPGGRPRIRLL